MSPNSQQSGASHCITVHTYVKIHERNNFGDDIKAWSIEGTPADCVIFALNYLKLDIDLVVSGINNGPNLGTDTIYSGTLAGATEALVHNIPAVAFSADFEGFETAKKEMPNLLKMIFNEELYSTEYVLNVNFPMNKFDEVKGIKITEQGLRLFQHEFVEDGDKIWSRGGWGDAANEPHTDVYAFESGYISLSAMGISRNYIKGQRKLEKILKKIEKSDE